jgi:SAM-dependent methyltransferase
MPLINDSDRDWERFGSTDPYFAVLTAPEFHGRVSGAERARFFESGVEHIDTMFSIIREHLDSSFAPKRALDFGCGVGRLLIPLAARCSEVTGMDISPSMLAESLRNCEVAGVTGVRLVLSDDRLSTLDGEFDFIHTYIVLQHIPVKRGETIVRGLVKRLAPNGIAVLQVPYTGGRDRLLNKILYWTRMAIPGGKQALNILRGKPPRAPVMQMNPYSVTRLLDIISSEGCREVHVRFSEHNGARGVLLFARKHPGPIFT